MSGRFGIVVLTCCAIAAGLLMAGSALAAFPGTNGKIAFVHDPGTAGATSDIFAMDPTGQNRTPLTSTPDDDYTPSWSADGEKIAFARNPPGSPSYGQIWVMNHDGTSQIQLTSGSQSADDYAPALSPGGNKIAFERFGGTTAQVWVMNADGSGQTQLTFPGPNGDEGRAPVFSPDGQKIAFARYDGATGFSEIWIMNADGSGQTALTTGSATASDSLPDFSPNGQKIVFGRSNDPPTQSDIFVMNADGSGQSQITSGNEFDYGPVFSPDGTRIAFVREYPPSYNVDNIFLVDSAGLNQNLTPLTSNDAPVFDYVPDWQPLNPPACDLTGKQTSKSVKKVSITVTCANENATVVAEGSGRAPKVPKAAVISKAKKFKIPAVTSQAQAGAPTTITLKISKKGQKALKKAAKAGKKGKATITATLTDELGQSSSDSFKVKFKAKKKK
jgi:Tol biopolymer transport system component